MGFGFWCAGWGKHMEQCSNKKYFSWRFCHTVKLTQSENLGPGTSLIEPDISENQDFSVFEILWRDYSLSLIYFLCVGCHKPLQQYSSEKYFAGWFWHTLKCNRGEILTLIRASRDPCQLIFFFLKFLILINSFG